MLIRNLDRNHSKIICTHLSEEEYLSGEIAGIVQCTQAAIDTVFTIHTSHTRLVLQVNGAIRWDYGKQNLHLEH